MPAPLIAITVGDKTPTPPYCQAVVAAGGRPWLLRPGDGIHALPPEAAALVLTGGASVAPERYGTTIEPGVKPSQDLDRDALEFSVLAEALERGLPVLGICRGMQLINVYFGGTLHQELSRTSFAPVHRPAEPRDHRAHTVRAVAGRLADILGTDELWVNSIHRQGVKALGTGLEATVFSPDGLTEGLETPDGQILAVQWHPEELCSTDEPSRRLFADLLARITAPTAI